MVSYYMILAKPGDAIYNVARTNLWLMHVTYLIGLDLIYNHVQTITIVLFLFGKAKEFTSSYI